MWIKHFIGCVIVTTISLVIASPAVAELELYWTTMESGNSAIQRADKNGSGADVVLNLRSPYDLAVDVTGGKVYWTDDASGMIQRANLDGSAVEDLVSTGGSGPMGIALDVAAGKMYWTDQREARIQRANFDGSSVEVLLETGLSTLFGMALDVANGKMYWADVTRPSTIQRANLDGSDLEELVPLGPGIPLSIALDAVGEKMYWIDAGTGKIQRANLDGSGVEDLVTTEGLNPRDIALDVVRGKMYWTDESPSTIRRANLDGSNVKILVVDEFSMPLGIALAIEDPNGRRPGSDGDDIAWNVTGVDVGLVACTNKTNGQKLRINVESPASGSCSDLGLVWNSGDDIDVKVVGNVESVEDARGVVTGINADLLVCKNKSTDPQEKARIEGPRSSWNWGDAALTLAPGDRVRWRVKGPAQ